MKKIVSLFLALTMALSLAACGSKTGEQAAAGSGTQKEDTLVKEISSPVEIQFWHSVSNPVHAGILENLIKEFNDTVGQEKGITVVPTFNGSSSELYSNVIAAIKAGNAPDVTLALRPYVADYLQTDYVVDLAPTSATPMWASAITTTFSRVCGTPTPTMRRRAPILCPSIPTLRFSITTWTSSRRTT